ncbi:hypothetical protein [Fodinibius salsisoli]|uniref:Uncharacterized protein n=1 Tax=Fodinibius salsisoli TaxID=2820877 RepID=A0ABT3PJ37_9BACT|nr:hypothetical protein [Fodinibius salsisoli]MCW9705952.1 hypothetical protein [Fodinibius salsisoli]
MKMKVAHFIHQTKKQSLDEASYSSRHSDWITTHTDWTYHSRLCGLLSPLLMDKKEALNKILYFLLLETKSHNWDIGPPDSLRQTLNFLNHCHL